MYIMELQSDDNLRCAPPNLTLPAYLSTPTMVVVSALLFTVHRKSE